MDPGCRPPPRRGTRARGPDNTSWVENCLAGIGSRGLDIELRPEEIHHHFPVQFVARLESQQLDEVGRAPVTPGIRTDGIPVQPDLETPATTPCTAPCQLR